MIDHVGRERSRRIQSERLAACESLAASIGTCPRLRATVGLAVAPPLHGSDVVRNPYGRGVELITAGSLRKEKHVLVRKPPAVPAPAGRGIGLRPDQVVAKGPAAIDGRDRRSLGYELHRPPGVGITD